MLRMKIQRILPVIFSLMMVLTGCYVKEPKTGLKSETRLAEYGEITASELEEMLLSQDVCVTETKYLVQDLNYQWAYPDMLCAIFENRGTEDIKNIVVAFAAWDARCMPLEIKGKNTLLEGTYIQKVCLEYEDFRFMPGTETGYGIGYEVKEDATVSVLKAIVVSYETFDGKIWENPYYNLWEKMYCGVRYSDSLSIL